MDESAAEARSPAAAPKRATAWISKGFEELLYAQAKEPSEFDVVIVGSGYGGAIAAAELAGSTSSDGASISVCVLERGIEYLSGMFPSRLADLAGYVRFSTPYSPAPRGAREGLFDFRVGTDVSALVASGLGGGSLINAGVMAEPKPDVFAGDCWPRAFRNPARRAAYYAHAKKRLGATVDGKDNTILRHVSGETPSKFSAFEKLARDPGTFRAAPITIAMRKAANSAGVPLDPCIMCGDCATGCNYNAK